VVAPSAANVAPITLWSASTLVDPRHPAPLINRYVDAPSEHPPSAASSPSLLLPAAAADANLIANGAYSPIAGFMGRADYESVVHHA
jgi:ATP sulfurylase